MLDIKFEGKYVTGRSPCEWYSDGSREWFETQGFEVIKVLKGNLKTIYIEISYDDHIALLEESKEYIVTIRLSEERFKELKLDNKEIIMTYLNPIVRNEIVKIEIKE